jgi:hypothetical protein
LGIQGMDKDRVSRLCRELDEHVEQFRTRPLEGAYRYLWLDAKHVKVRDRGRVLSKALVIAYGVHESGRARSSASISARSRARPSGPSSSAVCAHAAWAACGWSSPITTRA